MFQGTSLLKMDGKTDEKFQRTSESVHSLAVFFTVLALVSVVLVVLVPAFAFLCKFDVIFEDFILLMLFMIKILLFSDVCQSSLLNLEPSAWISLETLANFPMVRTFSLLFLCLGERFGFI